MIYNEYTEARELLGWTHQQLGRTLGIQKRSTYRYAAGDTIPEPTARLLRLLVMLRMRLPERQFDKIVRKLHA